MSFAGRMFQRQGFQTFGSMFTGKSFGRFSNDIRRSQQFNFQRSFHGFTKRAKISYSKKWNVYDELKLFSYSSHLAFFMLLPPILQMYTTKVEVTRDDTLHDSPFESLDTGNGVLIRNINISDMLNLEKDKLLNIYFQKEEAVSPSQQPIPIESLVKEVSSFEPEKEPFNSSIPRKQTYDPDFVIYFNKVTDAYTSFSRNKISEDQYYSKIERITDRLLTLQYKGKKDMTNNMLMKIFDQLHSLRLHHYELKLFRRILTSFDDPKLKLLRIRQKIISKYETSKSRNNKTIDTSIFKMINSSKWLIEYTSNFERFAQLIEMFAITNQNNKAFNSLIEVGLTSQDVLDKIHDSHLRYSLVSVLRGHERNKEAAFLEKKMRNLLSHSSI